MGIVLVRFGGPLRWIIRKYNTNNKFRSNDEMFVFRKGLKLNDAIKFNSWQVVKITYC